jgi:hypothetical protein
VPTDVDEAHRRYGATCGPIALAALVERNVAEVMKWFPHFPERCYTNGNHMQAAMDDAGLKFFWVNDQWPGDTRRRGVAWIQLEGSWLNPGVPMGAALSRTHWVAYRGLFVYDPNVGHWQHREVWEQGALLEWIGRTKGATGVYYPRKSFALH